MRAYLEASRMAERMMMETGGNDMLVEPERNAKLEDTWRINGTMLEQPVSHSTPPQRQSFSQRPKTAGAAGGRSYDAPRQLSQGSRVDAQTELPSRVARGQRAASLMMDAPKAAHAPVRAARGERAASLVTDAPKPRNSEQERLVRTASMSSLEVRHAARRSMTEGVTASPGARPPSADARRSVTEDVTPPPGGRRSVTEGVTPSPGTRRSVTEGVQTAALHERRSTSEPSLPRTPTSLTPLNAAGSTPNGASPATRPSRGARASSFSSLEAARKASEAASANASPSTHTMRKTRGSISEWLAEAGVKSTLAPIPGSRDASFKK